MGMQSNELILTVSSKKKKEEELNYLRTVKRPELTEAIKRAREYGDLSENFEYHAARQAQSILNGRIAALESLLERARVVDDAAVGGDIVGLGSIVAIKDLETDDDWEYTIVDATSADPHNDRISYSSPVGQALMHRKIGDIVEVLIPAGKARYEIVGLRHE
jgi:transcription elongation factor GreA